MLSKELYDVNLNFYSETEKAIKVSERYEEDHFWLPKSQIEFERRDDGTVDVTMPFWLCKEKKLAGF